MRNLVLRLCLLLVGLLLGGGVMLLVGVQAMFTKNRDVAVEAAPILFDVFQYVAIGLSGLALLGLLFCFKVRGMGVKFAAFLMLIATGAAGYLVGYIMPTMDRLRATGESGSDAFKNLHGQSMIVYLALLGASLLAFVMLSWRVRDEADKSSA